METEINPYEASVPGATLVKPSCPQPTRTDLSQDIRAFLASEITAFEFDERLECYLDSQDPVIQYVARAVWYFYDDCVDHLVCFSKKEWDYFQRLLLILASDCQVQQQVERRWDFSHLIALVALGGFIACATQLGWGYHLFLVSIPFGLLSIILSEYRKSRLRILDVYAQIIFPFATFQDLSKAYRSCDFEKVQYPKHLSNRRIRSPLMESLSLMRTYTAWLLFSPAALLAQAFPNGRTETRVTAA